MSKKEKKGTAKIAIIVIICLLVLTIVPTGIYSIVTKQSPVNVVSSVFSSNSELLIGKWQNDSRSSAYEFFEDGTYESYFSTFSFTGDYAIDGDKITLSNPSSDSTVTYKFSVDKKSLTMTIVKENGLETESDSEAQYNRVERIETKSLTDLLGDIANEAVTEELEKK